MRRSHLIERPTQLHGNPGRVPSAKEMRSSRCAPDPVAALTARYRGDHNRGVSRCRFPFIDEQEVVVLTGQFGDNLDLGAWDDDAESLLNLYLVAEGAALIGLDAKCRADLIRAPKGDSFLNEGPDAENRVGRSCDESAPQDCRARPGVQVES